MDKEQKVKGSDTTMMPGEQMPAKKYFKKYNGKCDALFLFVRR